MTLQLIKTPPPTQPDEAANDVATALLRRWTAAVVRDRVLRSGSDLAPIKRDDSRVHLRP